jgi:predicted N-acyltransferase
MDYLQPGFFHHLAELMPDRMLMAEVTAGNKIVAAALYLETEGALYGRYWGCAREVEFLHFETAYYAGIERCIERGIPLFEAGAQGTHKLLRGFEPSPTYSAHWLADPRLDHAIRDFLELEAQDVAARMRELATRLPYKTDDAD